MHINCCIICQFYTYVLVASYNILFLFDKHEAGAENINIHTKPDR